MRVLQDLVFSQLNRADGRSFDPEPEWDADSLLSEIKILEKRLYGSVDVICFDKNQAPTRHFGSLGTSDKKSTRPFVVRLPNDEMLEHEDDLGEDDDSDNNEDESNRHGLLLMKPSAPGDYAMYAVLKNDRKPFIMRVSDDDGDLDSDDDDLDNDEGNLIEAALNEMIHEFQLSVQDEIRSQSFAIKTKLMANDQKLKTALAKIAKYLESRRDVDRKVDTEFRRMLAETVDNHLTAIRRHHEVKSQVEERKIMNDAAEEAKRKEKILHEENLREEKAKTEAEAKRKEEEAKRISLEAERKEKEAADKLAAAIAQESAASLAQESASVPHPDSSSATKKFNPYKAAKSALEAEQNRLQKLKEFYEMIQMLKSKQDYSSHERHMARLIRTISGTKDNVRTRASELIKLMIDPAFPKPISIVTFCKKVLLHCKSYNIAVVFGCAHLIVVVTSKISLSMDILLAEFHQACIFTVPKSTVSKSQYESEEAYYKALGFQEENGKFEKEQDFLKGIESYMKLYGAIVQTEVEGHFNSHGLAEGWSWLARFLNALPANKYTTVALNAFLQTAGFALYRKYKSQFRKMLNVIAEDYLSALKGRQDLALHQVISEIQSYIKDQKFLRRPEGSVLETSSMSSQLVPFVDTAK